MTLHPLSVRLIPILTALLVALTCSVSEGASLQFDGTAGSITLHNAGARQQLVVSRTVNDRPVDVSADVTFQVEPQTIASVDKTGFVTPLANGKAVITARLGEDTATIPVIVSSVEKERDISFPNDIIPQLTRAGCNSGACHGTPSGKNNFRLSLLGFEPESDHEFLTKESRGRRIFPPAPDESFVLRKASGIVPHGGGARIKHGSDEYRLLRRWIAEGLPYGPANDPVVERIEVSPTSRVIAQKASQQLVVTAYFSDGTTRDITRVAEYKANQPDRCEVDHHGRVHIKDRTGTTSVMIRFQEHVSVFMATVPLGQPTPNLPEPANFIDQHVFAKLKTLGLPPSGECDDSTFLRRTTLDLTGRIPTLAETQEFLASKEANRRTAKIDQLLDSVGYAQLFANKWSGILRNKSEGGLEQVSRETHGFYDWIQASLNANKPFDQSPPSWSPLAETRPRTRRCRGTGRCRIPKTRWQTSLRYFWECEFSALSVTIIRTKNGARMTTTVSRRSSRRSVAKKFARCRKTTSCITSEFWRWPGTRITTSMSDRLRWMLPPLTSPLNAIHDSIFPNG
jgi:hypothetical protein